MLSVEGKEKYILIEITYSTKTPMQICTSTNLSS